jgi:hypothetical protein
MSEADGLGTGEDADGLGTGELLSPGVGVLVTTADSSSGRPGTTADAGGASDGGTSVAVGDPGAPADVVGAAVWTTGSSPASGRVIGEEGDGDAAGAGSGSATVERPGRPICEVPPVHAQASVVTRERTKATGIAAT